MKNVTLAMLALVPLVAVGCATRTTERVVATPPATVVTTPSSGTVVTPGTGAVVTAPSTSPVVVAASPATAGATRITGRVTDVERDGEIKLRTTDGHKVKVHVSPATAATVREGDLVTLDVMFGR
jgi:translation initiation factor IF-1